MYCEYSNGKYTLVGDSYRESNGYNETMLGPHEYTELQLHTQSLNMFTTGNITIYHTNVTTLDHWYSIVMFFFCYLYCSHLFFVIGDSSFSC